jgi:DNA-directed RNA polymerase specialized sigma24 family protein
VLTSRRDAEFTEFVTARMTALRRVAFLLCQDWHRADDLVQVAITRLCANWHRASVMDLHYTSPENLSHVYARALRQARTLRSR